MSEKKEKRAVNWKRLGHLMVCLVLVCVILVNSSPIRAKAVEPVTMVMVSAASVIASVMIGIGVMMGQNQDAFDQVVQMVQGSNALKDFIQKDERNTEVIPLYRSPGNGGVGSGPLSLLVAGELIEVVRQILFNSNVLTDSGAGSGCSVFGNVTLPFADVWDLSKHPYAILVGVIRTSGDIAEYRLFWSSSNFNWSIGYDFLEYCDCYRAMYSVHNSRWQSVYSPDPSVSRITLSSGYHMELLAESSAFGGSDPVPITFGDGDLTIGEIAPQQKELSEGYSDWVAGSQWDVNNSQWWPIAVGQTYDETVGFSQAQVQAGEGTYIVADSPVYNVNLPLAGSLTYERFATAQPLTVSAAVTDGGTIRYEWFRYQMEPSLGASESVGEGPSIVPETSNTGKWTYYCKATNSVSGVSSLPVTSNYVTVTIIDPNEQENPDISPTEAPGVDPDPGGDPDPGVDPDIDPDNQTDLENSGNENVDHLIEIIPDHSGEFGEALKALADSMSYEGTEAILTIPQVNFPALGNLVPGFVMMEEQQINFADYVEMMPANLLLLVRCLLTAALIMYCFYELYSSAEYVLVLRRD